MIVAEQVVAALDGGVVTNAVNIPIVDQADLEVLGLFIPLASQLGRIAVGLAAGPPRRIAVAAYGPLSEYDTSPAHGGGAQRIVPGACRPGRQRRQRARDRRRARIEVVEERNRASRDYTNTIEVRLLSDGEEIAVSGTTIGPEPRLFLGALGFGIDMEIAPHMVFVRYPDQPGVIGRVGAMFGDGGINIANMAVSRTKEGGEALMVFSIDTAATTELVGALREMGFDDVRFVEPRVSMDWPEPSSAWRRSPGHGRRGSPRGALTETGSAEAAADAIGCTLGQVVKSLVLVCDGVPVVALVPGDRKADTGKVARLVEAPRGRRAPPGGRRRDRVQPGSGVAVPARARERRAGGAHSCATARSSPARARPPHRRALSG